MKASVALLFLISATALGQTWEQVDSKAMPDEITAYSFDERGAIYLGTSTGLITKIDSEGAELSFAYPNSGVTTLIEGRNALLPFLFFRDNQRAIILDRFLSNPVVYEVGDLTRGFVWLATPAIDRHIWLLTTSPLTILKVDPVSGSIVQSTPLLIDFPLEDVVFFKAQRNLLIIVDRIYGVLVFDLFGNPVTALEQAGLAYAHVDGSELVTHGNGRLYIQPMIQTAKIREIEALPGD